MGEGRRETQPVDERLDDLAIERADGREAWKRGDVGEHGEEAISNLLELLGCIGIKVVNIKSGVQMVEGLLQHLDAAAFEKDGLEVLKSQIGQCWRADFDE